MRLKELLNEGLQHPIICVDVQPEYCHAGNICQRIVNFVQKQTGPVLMFVNAEDQGMTGDTVESIMSWWEEAAGAEFDEESGTYNEVVNWSRFAIVDKGYGYLRSWMDSPQVSDRTIIKVVRLMYQNKVNDSRMLFGGENSDDYAINMQSLVGDEFEEWMLSDPLITNWTSIAQLKRFNGAYIVGGGREECLREVELLMNAFNIRYKRIDSLVY
jgi:hypothetical protein